MREGNYLQVFLLLVLVMILPSLTYAEEIIEIKSSTHWITEDLISIDPQQDEKGSKDKKGKDSKKEPEAEKPKEPQPEPKIDIDAKKPNIKEVPRARPKLRPEVVDKVRIKRPPVRVKPGKGLRIDL